MINLTIGTLVLICLISYSLGNATIWFVIGSRRSAMITVVCIIPAIVLVIVRLLS